MLLNNWHEIEVLHVRRRKFAVRLRYGSKGELVSEVQKKLKTTDYYQGNIDQDFGPGILRAVLQFQTDYFGDDADDGIVDSMTASVLGINWINI